VRDRLRQVARALRLMLGLPDYETYCAHQRRHHPGVAPMNRGAFLRLCQERRFGGKGAPTRCC
jgi:uncharacterized short protein YbdD (DUF466 family)